MNRLLLTGAVFAVLSLTGCERKPPPDVKPPEPSMPGPASPPGAAGSPGQQVPQGAIDDGKSDKAVPPPEPAPAN